MIGDVVAPLFHNNDPVKPDAVNTELPQLLTTATDGVAGLASGAAIPVPLALVHPFDVCVTVYVPAVVTVIEDVLAPLLHNNAPLKPDAVNKVLPQLLVTATEGAAGNGFTVSVAAFELTVLTLLVHAARYCLLLSAVVVTNDNVAFVAPVIFVHVVPFVVSCHCTVGTGVPLAAELKLAFTAAHLVWDAGCVVIVGGVFAETALPLISNSEVLAC